MKASRKILTALALLLALIVIAVPAVASDDSNELMLSEDGSTPAEGGSTANTPTDTPSADKPVETPAEKKDYVEFLKDNWFLVLILAIGLLTLAYGIYDDTNEVIVAIGIILAAASAVLLYGVFADIDIIETVSDWIHGLGGSKDAT